MQTNPEVIEIVRIKRKMRVNIDYPRSKNRLRMLPYKSCQTNIIHQVSELENKAHRLC